MEFYKENTQILLQELTETALKTGDVEKLTTCGNPQAIMTRFFENNVVKEKLTKYVQYFIQSGRFKKDKEISKEYRLKGNEIFKSQKPQTSLRYFSLAVKYAPFGTEELRLAFGNRSASLFFVKEYESCLSDISNALKKEICSERKIKLYIRKGKCLLRLKRFDEALEIFNSALQNLNDIFDQKSANVKGLKSDIVKCLAETKKHMCIYKVSNEFKEEEVPLPIPSFGSNPDFPCASNALLLRTDPEKGRHVVTIQSVKRGDVLFVEKPFAFVVLPTCSLTHCHNCCKKINNPFPCRNCAEGNYCSEKCESLAWEAYHKWECGPGLDLAYTVGIAHLGLRLALLGKTSHQDSRYQEVKKLVSHIENLDPGDLYQYTVTSALLVTLLETTSYFKDFGGNLETVGGVILEHIAQLICNGHALTELSQGPEEQGVYSEVQVRIATGIYPSASMMNHSCNSNIMNSFLNEYLIVKATRDIQMGEEVFNCYGPHFRRMPWEERQCSLKDQYKFKCLCEPCTEPSKRNFSSRFCAYLCCSCKGPAIPINGNEEEAICIDCNSTNSISSVNKVLEEADHLFEKGNSAFENNDVKTALIFFSRVLSLRSDVLYEHHKNIRDCRDNLARCYSILGDYKKSFDYVEENLKGNEEQFEQCSPELTNEIFKLVDIFIKLFEVSPGIAKERGYLKKTLDYLVQVKSTAEILFGSWHSKYKEILYLLDKIEVLAGENVKTTCTYN